MPPVGPPTFAAMLERQRSETEIFYSESKGTYIGSAIVATIIGLVFGVPVWRLAHFIARTADALTSRLLIAVLLAVAGILAFLLWRQFGLHRRHELLIHPAARDFILLTHRLLGASQSLRVEAPAVREVLLAEEPWAGSGRRTVWELWVVLQDGNGVYLDRCEKMDSLLPLAQTLSSCLAVSLREKRARK